jgi:hypothetical protein
MKNINTISANAAAKSPQKPNCYDTLKTQNDVVALQTYIETLNAAEKSACIVYAICEKVDNTLILQKLCESATFLQVSDTGMLVDQIAHEEYDIENFNVVTSSDTLIGKSMNILTSN